MAQHPHKAFLDEIQIAIKNLPPGLDSGVKEQAQKELDAFLGNPEVQEKEIKAMLIELGKKEWPYRNAFTELNRELGGAYEYELVLDHVEPPVAQKIKKLCEDGGTLEALVKSQMFETEFTGEEKHQIEDALLDAQIHLREDQEQIVAKSKDKFDSLIIKWKEKQKKLSERIEALKVLGNVDPKWKKEIEDKVEKFEEGWSVVESDVTEEEVKKEIEYWQGTLALDEK
ncbi:MAG: hypothetical protein ACD_76C00154G0002 [uncultured bacterium]|nr:MAG: hypothetical protein ACD_76C00154G0002 [uncultured bacterium]HBD05476.1 hypothetical protein [Candidatus Uhrbacteria bacterium]